MKNGNAKNKGVAIILVAGILLGFLLVFAVLAIDFSRMYYVRGELQNAADAAALAGAQLLDGTNSFTQNNARTEAVLFAGRNNAAGAPVALASNNTNTLTDSNDITVGNWNSTTRVYTPNITPVNAVQVRTRRTTGSPGGPVPLLFSSLVPGLTNMGVIRQAIAVRPLRASQFVAVCGEACANGATSCVYPNPPCNLTPVRQFESGPCSTGFCADKIAWTSLTTSPTSASAVSGLFCPNTPFQNVCGSAIYTTMGTVASTMQDFESIMFNPLFDSVAKTCLDGACNSASDKVMSWTLIVPVTQTCPPGANSTVPVFGYARIRVTAICASGGGSPCQPYNSSSGGGVDPCTLYPNNRVMVDQIQCISCLNPDVVSGFKAVLVR